MPKYPLKISLMKPEGFDNYLGFFSLPVDCSVLEIDTKNITYAQQLSPNYNSLILGEEIPAGKYRVFLESKEKIVSFIMIVEAEIDITMTVFNQLSLALGNVGVNTTLYTENGNDGVKTFYTGLKDLIRSTKSVGSATSPDAVPISPSPPSQDLSHILNSIANIEAQLLQLSAQPAVSEPSFDMEELKSLILSQRPTESINHEGIVEDVVTAIKDLTSKLVSISDFDVLSQKITSAVEKGIEEVRPVSCNDEEINKVKEELRKQVEENKIMHAKLLEAEDYIDNIEMIG